MHANSLLCTEMCQIMKYTNKCQKILVQEPPKNLYNRLVQIV